MTESRRTVAAFAGHWLRVLGTIKDEALRVRNSMVLLICGLSAVLLYLVLSGSIGFHNAILDNEKYSLLGTVIQTSGTFGAVALAMVFLTAQLGGVGRPSVIRELYRSKDVYVFFGYSAATVLVGYVAMLTTGSLGAPWNDRVLDSVFILAGASLLLVLPALMSQIENLDQTRLAAKLASRIRVDEVIEYGRADAYPVPGISPQDYGKLPHARPSDPLRPLHELIKEAVDAQDRVLFGRLFRLLLTPVARAHGLKWDYYGLKRDRSRKAGWITRLKSKEYTCDQKTDVAKVILNYSVKRARNLLHNAEWGELDVGRHAILAGISSLIRCLANVKDGTSAIDLCLYATFHIEEAYRGVEPHGHVEPMNAFFNTAELLFKVEKKPEAELCARILGWVSVHTKQLSADRASRTEGKLCEELKTIYDEAVQSADRNPNWIPLTEDNKDPWKNQQPASGEA